jgi:hypothetical protein
MINKISKYVIYLFLGYLTFKYIFSWVLSWGVIFGVFLIGFIGFIGLLLAIYFSCKMYRFLVKSN